MHASTVPLILNPSTGAITMAFHVVFDDWFATVPSGSLPAFDSDEWQCLFGDSSYQYILNNEAPPNTSESDSRSDTIAQAKDSTTPPVPLDVPPSPLLPTQVLSDQMPMLKPPPPPMLSPREYIPAAPTSSPTTTSLPPPSPLLTPPPMVWSPREPPLREPLSFTPSLVSTKPSSWRESLPSTTWLLKSTDGIRT